MRQTLLTFISLICFNMDFYNSQDYYNNLHLYDGSDFLLACSTSLFVDKTSLIKYFFDNIKRGYGTLILAPERYGKSTNLNMLKRFFSVNVDNWGRLKYLEDTNNYNLFTNNYLNIYKSIDFFNEQFGKYPVIFIDYKPLIDTLSFDDVFLQIEEIIKTTFQQHEYIINETMEVKTDFRIKLEYYIKGNLKESEMESSLAILAKTLQRYFNKRVIVLMDNYNICFYSYHCQDKRIFRLLSAINHNLLTSDSVEKSFVTGLSGIIPDFKVPQELQWEEILPSNIIVSDLMTRGFFGLSEIELEKLLQIVVSDSRQRGIFMNELKKRYTYPSRMMDSLRVCSIANVMTAIHEISTDHLDYQEYDF